MRTHCIALLFVSLMVCSCSKKDSDKVITPEQARTACVKFLYNRGYTVSLHVVMERVGETSCTYRFMTNGVEVFEEVIVDRHTGMARFR